MAIADAQGTYTALGIDYNGAQTLVDHLDANGVAITPPASETPSGTPLVARINHGRWLVDCPDDTNAEAAGSDDPRFFCTVCRNAGNGGDWRPVTWPADVAAVEASLDGLPVAEQNWTP